MSRVCIDCRSPISLANGVLNRRSLYGFAVRCRGCHAADQRARYWADPERHRARARDYQRRARAARAIERNTP